VNQDICIPDIGDAESVEVIEILVAIGQEVGPDDPVLVIESDKASMEVPAGVAGRITALRVALGDQVRTGEAIATVELAGAETAEAPASSAAPAPTFSAAPTDAPSSTVAAAAAGAPVPAEVEIDVVVPDVGEAQPVTVIEIAVKPGDEVAVGDLLMLIESDKASMEIAAETAGRVVAVHVAVGDEVGTGTRVATLARQGVAAVEPQPASGKSASAAPPPESVNPAPIEPLSPARAQVAALFADAERAVREGPRSTVDEEPHPTVYAGPAVRRLARELGVTLDQIKGSGLRGRIIKDDVKAYVKQRMTAAPASTAGATGGLPALPVVDFSRFGPIDVVPLSRIRARGADNLHRSWVNVPHVTQHDEADVTDLEAFRAVLRDDAQARGVRLTPLPFIIKACCQALAEFPTFNASLDASARNFIMKRYCHVGIAVDTDDGLLVPVIRDADRKGIWALAAEAAALAEKARGRKLAPADLQGGTFSVTSLGAQGGTGFTPIINAPEVAILGVARLATRPVWDGSAFVPRQMLPLSLSYDHRAINGAEAARFMTRLTALLGDVRRLAL
jgi:pyruvate dehydrogenase E2 component (dihydrolipoamide acetyltransferase)